jgi:hypothetical protein
VSPARAYMVLLHLAVVAAGVWAGIRLIAAIAGP